MAFFKFRKGGDEQTSTAPPPESVEAMRKRAKHRLIGAAVLVLIGVIGFPLLFDNQPRPIAVDIPIEIPDKNKTKPLSIPVAPAAPAAVPAAVAPAPAPAVSAATPAVPAPVAAAKVEDKAAKPAAAPASEAAKTAAKPETRPADKPLAKPEEGAKPQALLEGKEADKKDTKEADKKAVASDERFIVQVGAFADVTKARAARLKLEQAGLKTYTQVVETKDGRRIRVRVGPFAGKAEADKAAEKIKKLDLPAAILTL